MSPIPMILALTLLVSCVHEAPKELVNARAAYEAARVGPASTMALAELHTAQEALAAAEKSFVDEPRSYHTKDLAYVAVRAAEKATALGELALEAEKTASAEATFSTMQTAMLKETKESLIASEAAGSAEVKVTEAAKVSDAEKRAGDARSAEAEVALAKMSKTEARGVVITLPDSGLFRAGQSTLAPDGIHTLDKVAITLLENDGRMLVVEGHSDSVGDETTNRELAQRRANTVRTYLIERGYEAGLIRAVGIGEVRPITDNTTVEGRDQNARIEIIITK